MNKNIKKIEEQLQKETEEIIEEETSSKGEKTELGINVKKKVTKPELCKIILQHYMVRANLVGAILSSVLKNKKDNFCMKRILALEYGNVCYPNNTDKVLKASTEIDASNMIEYFIFNFTKGECDSLKGSIFKDYPRDKIEKIKSGETELSKKYINNIKSIRGLYSTTIKELKNILDQLLQNAKLTNEDLKKLCEKTSDLLKKLYTEVQVGFIKGTIILLQLENEIPKIIPKFKIQ